MQTWKKSFYALWAAEFLAIAGFSTTNPILPLYLTELGIHDPALLNWWTGAINACPAIALAVFAPIWGSIADGYGRKLMLLRAMIGGALLLGLLALTNAPWQVLLIKILQGCVTGTIAAATVLTASIVPEEEAGYRLGLLQMSVFLGGAVGPLFGGVITDLLGSRVNFVATSLMLLVSAVVVARWVSEDFKPRPRTGSLLRNAVPDFGVFAASPALIPLFAVTFAVQLANTTAGPILPLVVLDMSKGGPGVGSLTGLILGATAITASIGAVLVGKVSLRIGYGRSLLICIAGSLVFTLPQAFARTPYQLLAFRALMGFFLGGTMPSLNALLAGLCERSRQGSVYGLSSSVQNAGAAFGPALGAFVATDFGYPAAFLTTGAILAATGAGVAPSLWRRRRDAPGAAAYPASGGGIDD
jgi:DHA1 family multidrug resistance protein-like MFS transporter